MLIRHTTRSVTLFLFIMILCTHGALADSITTLRDLEAAVSENLKDIKTMAVDFTQTIHLDADQTLSASGTMSFLLPEKMAMVFSSEMMGQKLTNTTINDGKILWTESRMGKNFVQVYKLDVSALDKMPNLAQLPDIQNQNMSFDQMFNALEVMKENFTLSWKGTRTIGEEDFYEVEALMTDDGKKKFESLGPTAAVAVKMGAKQTLLYDPRSFFLKKMVLYDGQGNETFVFTFSNHRKNVALEPSSFEYQPPADARVVDMTPMLEQMFPKSESPEGTVQ